jgi:hypothetical protein
MKRLVNGEKDAEMLFELLEKKSCLVVSATENVVIHQGLGVVVGCGFVLGCMKSRFTDPKAPVSLRC